MFFPDLFLAPTVQASERLNDGGTAIPLLWTNTGEVDSVDGGILAGTEEHSYHMWAMFSSQALTLQLAVLTCHVQTDSLHQSRLIFVPREIWVYSYLDNVMCGRLGRGQLSPWGWLRNSYCLYFLVKVQTRHAWAHFLLCHRHVFGLSLSVSKCASCVIDGFHGHLVVWDDGHWAPPVMLTGMKEAPRLGSWTRLLAVIITGWTKLINGMVIGCYHTCDDAALLLSVIPVSFTPAWNVKAETFSLMLFEASLEKTAWVCFTHSLVSDGF